MASPFSRGVSIWKTHAISAMFRVSALAFEVAARWIRDRATMRRAIILAGVSSLNVVVGFASQWYIFTTLGPGRETDAYFAALVIPTLVLAVVSGSLMHVLVPLLSVGDDEAFRREAWTFFQGIALGFGAVAVPLALAAQWWVPLPVPGFGQEARDLTVHIVRVQLLGMVFTAATGVLWAE